MKKYIKELIINSIAIKLAKIVFILLIAILLSLTSCRNEYIEKVRPNIVIINVDDMGWKDVGFMGSKYYETPNIDSLSSLGMVFTNGYASSANCAPSRASLMTGKWTTRHGIYTVNSSERGETKNRKIIPTQNKRTLSREHEVIPDVLGRNGYSTCHAGKWHLSDDPLDYGFDINIAGGHNGLPLSYYPPYKNVNLAGSEDQYLTDLIMEKAIGYIDTVQDPFFLYYAPYAVHVPIEPVHGLLKKYQQKASWKGQGNPEYATMVENLDRNIGLMVSKLKEKGIFNNTLIVFTSDNGGLYGITKQRPLRAGKGSYYEGGIREPFFFVLQDRIGAHTVSDVPITNLDLFPTILSYAKVKYDESSLDGNNISQILEGKVDELHRPLYWHFPIYLESYYIHDNENRDSLFRTRPGAVVRNRNWKLHYYFENKEVELYNLVEDIGERNDLSVKEPEKTEEMINLLEKWWEETNAPIPTTINPEYVETNIN